MVSNFPNCLALLAILLVAHLKRGKTEQNEIGRNGKADRL